MTDRREIPKGIRNNESRRQLTISTAVFFIPVMTIVLCLWQSHLWAGFDIFPRWCWLLAGISSLICTSRWSWRQRMWRAAAGLWIAYTLIFVEETQSLARSCLPVQAVDVEQRIRVVSLNCGSGNARLVEVFEQYRPDVVLLQESPGRERVQAWTKSLFGDEGDYVWGSDCSIIARGKLRPIRNSPAEKFVLAEYHRANGEDLIVGSLRLYPPPIRLDVYRPAFWRKYWRIREIHVEELRPLDQFLGVQRLPVVIGGDFNCPAHDPVADLSHLKLQDAFRVSGRGWGNTMENDYPFHRIDRVWTNHEIEAISVIAADSKYSDHRLVVFDGRLARGE